MCLLKNLYLFKVSFLFRLLLCIIWSNLHFQYDQEMILMKLKPDWSIGLKLWLARSDYAIRIAFFLVLTMFGGIHQATYIVWLIDWILCLLLSRWASPVTAMIMLVGSSQLLELHHSGKEIESSKEDALRSKDQQHIWLAFLQRSVCFYWNRDFASLLYVVSSMKINARGCSK